jgi:ABC-type metal ion transport system substrate-binding protein
MKKNLISLISVFLLVALIVGIAPAALAAEPVKIGIPDDATNGGRAIKLLETVGLITVDPEAGWVPELKDVTGYFYNIEIVPTQANTLPATLDDFGAATINGTYAIPTGLVPSRDGLAIESQADASGEDGNPFVNVVVARTEDKDNELYKTIQEAFQSDVVGQYLIAKYSEAFIPAFDYENTEYSNDELLELIDGYKTDKKGKTEVKVGVCGASNDHWKAVQYVLDQNEADIYIKLVEFDAYNLPNEALNSSDIDLNSFQHKAYLANEVNSQGYEIETIFDTLMAPLTLYSKQFDSVDALKETAGEAA